MIHKNFCCKKVIETFMHRLTASGLYFEYQNDKSFLFRLPFLLKFSEVDSSKRKVTLTDVAPAFIIFLIGYFASFLVFMGEILISPRKKVNYFKKLCTKTFCITDAILNPIYFNSVPCFKFLSFCLLTNYYI